MSAPAEPFEACRACQLAFGPHSVCQHCGRCRCGQLVQVYVGCVLDHSCPASAPQAAPRRDPGMEAHEAAKAHLRACQEAEDVCAETGEDWDAAGGPATAGPYCGCEDCDIREVLHAAVPILLGAVVEDLVAAGHAPAAQRIRSEWSL